MEPEMDAEANLDTLYGRYLTFIIGEETYGIQIRYVTEIIGMQSITRVPEVPAFIKGIINLRGKIIPVVDVRHKFHKQSVAYDDRTCIIVVDADGLIAGLIVDKVSDVLSIDDRDIVSPPSHVEGLSNSYIYGIGKVAEDVKLLLECRKLFENTDQIQQAV